MARRHRNGGDGGAVTQITPNIGQIIIVILVSSIIVADCSHNDTEDEVRRVQNEIPKRLKIVEAVAGRGFASVYQNGTFRTGNTLWDNILNKCTLKPSVSCLQNNFYSYLDDSLEFNGDLSVTSGVCFKKNNVDVNKYSKEANTIYLSGSNVAEDRYRSLDEENEIKDDEESETPLEEVTDALYNKGVKFLMTHDMKLTLPEMMFNGATLKISPRALTKTGALVHIDLEPKEQEEGRIFINKIKKYIKKKLVMAALAIILVVKLIALKLVFLLPILLGVTTAKKMFMKILLFLFPALSHIFKLCSWYHQNYHTTKYHHHHHLITHHHKVPHAHHSHEYGPPSHGAVVIKQHAEHPPPSFEHYPQDWELSGPGLGSEYLSDIHRNAIANFKPHENDANDINAWGLGLPPGPGPSYLTGEIPNSNVANGGLKPAINVPGRVVGVPINPLRHKKTSPPDPLQVEKDALVRAATLASRVSPSPVRDEILRVSAAKLSESNRVKAETELVRQQQEILAAQDPSYIRAWGRKAMFCYEKEVNEWVCDYAIYRRGDEVGRQETVAAEKFYGSLVDRVDTILASIGARDIGCRERAVCALYKDPFRHSPYSNLVSNELSKDASDLVPPAQSKMALHYYKYVQAAREGQESKDCVSIYPQCSIDYS